MSSLTGWLPLRQNGLCNKARNFLRNWFFQKIILKFACMATFFLHHTRTRCLQFQIFAHLSSEDIWIFLFPSNCHTQKAENSPQGNFFSTCIIFDICDKYQVWCECWFGLMLSFGIQPRMSKKQNHWISENKSEPQMSETPNVRNPERPKPRTSETLNFKNFWKL